MMMVTLTLINFHQHHSFIHSFILDAYQLLQSWQKKLSSLGVAHFPWDPAPPQQQPAPQQTQNQILPPTATVPSNAPRPPPTAQTQQHHVPPQQLPQSVPGTMPPMQAPAPVGMPPMGQPPRIKTEPGTNGQGLPPLNNMMPQNPQNPQSAVERAASMLHQRYGAAAANSVSQLQAQSQAAMTMPGQPRPQHPQHPQQVPNGQGPPIKTEHGYSPVQQPPMGNAQTDGASDALSDWKAEVARRREAAGNQNGEGDRILREHLRQRMLQFEGGGLLVPLDEQSSSRAASGPALSSDSTVEPSSTVPRVPRAQVDGPGGDDDQEEDDEDAINSDLDDPDDLVADDHDGDDSVGQVMLCTYDKVQRVKNKWKCTLKDGILTTEGKEYVFHKGQGEFEW
ncbi:hypothetical protein AWENTII_010406 [Aspergillus wentii]